MSQSNKHDKMGPSLNDPVSNEIIYIFYPTNNLEQNEYRINGGTIGLGGIQLFLYFLSNI